MRQTKHLGLFPRRTIDSTLVASLLAVASAHATLDDRNFRNECFGAERVDDGSDTLALNCPHVRTLRIPRPGCDRARVAYWPAPFDYSPTQAA